MKQKQLLRVAAIAVVLLLLVSAFAFTGFAAEGDTVTVTPDAKTGWAFYTVKPEADGYYELSSNSEGDTYAQLCDAAGTVLAFDDDSGEGKNFCLGYQMKKGVTYTYCVRNLDGSTASFSISLSQGREIVSISVTTRPSKTQYYEGVNNQIVTNEIWNESKRAFTNADLYPISLDGMQLRVVYADGSARYFFSDELESLGIVPFMESLELGTNTVVLSYRDLTASFSVRLMENPVTSLEVAEQPYKMVYYDDGSELKLDGMSLRINYKDGSNEIMNYQDFAAKGIAFTDVDLAIGKNKIGFEYLNAKAELELTKQPMPQRDEASLYIRFASAKAANGATVSLMQDGKVKYETTADGSDLEIPDMPVGVYDLVVSKAGHLSYTITSLELYEDLDLADFAHSDLKQVRLPQGDIDGDGMISLQDVSLILMPQNYNKAADAEGVNAGCDVNGDGWITLEDISVLLMAENYNKSTFKIAYR